MAIYNKEGGSNPKSTSGSSTAYGSLGYDVKKIQELLNANGANLTVDGIYGPLTRQAVMEYQEKNGLAVDGIVGKNTWGALTKAQSGSTGTDTTPTDTTPKYEAYKPSDTVTQAEALLQQQLAQKPGDYTSPWQSQLNDIIQKIQNREKFSYDLNGDALYQQYKDQYMTQGKMAMMDTMGQAQAMTGGYGNSYAQSVGQQAYQGYLQQLNDKVPELYQLALSQYNAEGDAMYNQASLLAGMEEQDYGRYRDQVGDYYTELDRLTNDSRYQAEMDYSKWADDRNFSYQLDRDKVADQQWQAQFDEAKRQYDQQYALSASKSSSSGNTYTAPEGWTTAKIKSFQKANGLNPDGIWGPKTQAAYEAHSNYDTPVDANDDGKAKGWKDYDQATNDKLVKEKGGSYYRDTLNAMNQMVANGATSKEIMTFLQEAVGNSFITKTEYMNLVQKYRK